MNEETARLDMDRLRPLVRPTRNQAEVDLLPPYGDPEVHLLGELGTYFVVGAAATALLRRFGN